MIDLKKSLSFDNLYHTCHIYPVNALQISIRELHSHTGRYVDKATSRQRVIITHRGKPVAELKPYDPEKNSEKNNWNDRYLTPEFKKLQKSGELRISAIHQNVTDWISEDRDREIA